MNISCYRQHCEKHRHAHTHCTDTHALAHIGNKHRNSKINPLFLFARSLRPQNKNDTSTVAFRVSNTNTHLFPPESRGKQVATWITRNVAMDKGQCREGRELHTRDCVEAFSMKPSFDSHRKPQKVEQCLCLGLPLYCLSERNGDKIHLKSKKHLKVSLTAAGLDQDWRLTFRLGLGREQRDDWTCSQSNEVTF